MAGGPTRRRQRQRRRHRRSPPLPSPGRSVPVPSPGGSPTVLLLQSFKAASGRQEAALVDSNNLAREWREESSNLYLKKSTEKRYLLSRGKFEKERKFCLEIADNLLRRETVTVRNSDDIDWVGRLDALYGVLGSVRIRGHDFVGGRPVFRDLVREKNLQAVVVVE